MYLLDDHPYHVQYDTTKVTATVSGDVGITCIEGTNTLHPDPLSQSLLLTSNAETGATQQNALQITVNELRLEVLRLQLQV
jgi:hypothetical protein